MARIARYPLTSCRQRLLRALVLLALLASGGSQSPAIAAEPPHLTVLAYRQMAYVSPILEGFTQESGIEVDVISGLPDELLDRMSEEGSAGRADVLLTLDLANLAKAQERGVLRPISSVYLQQTVPPAWWGENRMWIAQSRWLKTIVFSRARLSAGVRHYEDLALPALRGQVCVRTSDTAYATSFMAAMIGQVGAAEAERWARSVVENLAAPPFESAKGLLAALADGTCAVGLDNSFYLARAQTSGQQADSAVAETVRVSAGGPGPCGESERAIVGISGAGIARHSPYPDSARRLLEFMARPENQVRYAQAAGELTVSVISKPAGEVMELPACADPAPPQSAARFLSAAPTIYAAAGWK